MSVPESTGGYALGPEEGEALWFNGGRGLLRATDVRPQHDSFAVGCAGRDLCEPSQTPIAFTSHIDLRLERD